MENTVIALDVGSVRIGVAASDALGITAQALETWTRKGLENDLAHFADLARARGAGALCARRLSPPSCSARCALALVSRSST